MPNICNPGVTFIGGYSYFDWILGGFSFSIAQLQARNGRTVFWRMNRLRLEASWMALVVSGGGALIKCNCQLSFTSSHHYVRTYRYHLPSIIYHLVIIRHLPQRSLVTCHTCFQDRKIPRRHRTPSCKLQYDVPRYTECGTMAQLVHFNWRLYQTCSGIPTLIKWGNYKLQVILTASSTNYDTVIYL